MAKFVVELRPNRPNVTESDPAEAFLGTRTDDEGREQCVPWRDVGRATVYESKGAAERDLKRLPDAFFDRYFATVVDVSAPHPGPYEVRVAEDDVVTGDKWVGKERTVTTSKSHSVVAPGKGGSEAVLVAEINASDRKAYGFPVSAEATANLLAAAPDLLAALKTLLADMEAEYRDRNGDADHDGMDKARAAIAKAEGK